MKDKIDKMIEESPFLFAGAVVTGVSVGLFLIVTVLGLLWKWFWWIIS